MCDPACKGCQGRLAEMLKLRATLKVAEGEAISDRCHRIRYQCCHICESLTCGDNTSPAVTQARSAEAQIAKAMSLLKPACAEENLEGAIRNLQQAHQSESYNAETLEREVKELRVYATHVENDNEAFLKENKEAMATLALANAELLRNESRIAELARCLSHESCSVCGQRYSVDPNSGMDCKLADHIEAYDAISGKVA